MLLLDTHVLLWLVAGDPKLGVRARVAIDQAWQSDQLGVSAISFWEAALLQDKGRIQWAKDLERWRRELLAQGLIEIPVNGQIGIRAVSLAPFHADPADRLIVATALAGHRLLTADRQILAWRGSLDCLKATE